MKLTRISTDHYNGQSACSRCNAGLSYFGYVNWSCMMVEFKELKGLYCPECAVILEKLYEEKDEIEM